MSKSNATSMFKSLKSSMIKHSPEILMGLGIAGMITTTVLAVKATPKALALIEEEKLRRYKEEEDENLTPVEVVKTCWKCYAPAVITSVASVTCLLGSRSVSARRTAALAAAYQISETALADYREKVVETIGEKKEQAVRDKVAEEKIKQNPVSKSEVIITQNGSTLCFEPLSARYFRSDQDRIKRAENALNKRLLHDISGYVSLNDFYDEVGLEHTYHGDSIGWNTENLLDISFSACLSDNGEPAMYIDFVVPPEWGRD